MSIDFHQFFIFIGIKLFFSVFRLFHNKNRILFTEIRFMYLLQRFIRARLSGRVNQKPPDKRLIAEIFLTVFHSRFHSSFREIQLIFIFYNLRYPDGSRYIYAVLIFYLSCFSDQESPFRLFIRFIAKLVQECIYIVFHINLGTVTYIPYLTYIFRKLFFHIFSPHIHIFSLHIIALTLILLVYVSGFQKKYDTSGEKNGRLVFFCTSLSVFFMYFVFPGRVLSTLRLSFTLTVRFS